MSDIQITIQPTSNVSLEVTVPSGAVTEYHVPVVPQISVIEKASVTYQSGTSIDELADIPDVSFSSLTGGQILGYDSDTQTWINVDQSAGAIESAINITNSDDAFSHMTTPIAVGTSFEAILRDMLEKYERTTIYLQNFKIQLEPLTGGGSYGSETTITSGASYEVGRKFKINGFDYQITDNSQTVDDSVAFLVGSTTIESGFSDNNAAKTLATPYELAPTSYSSYSFKVTATDDGGPSLPDETITSGTYTFYWKFNIRVGTSSTASITSDAEATTLFGNISDMLNILEDTSPSDRVVAGTSNSEDESLYTWIAWPVACGDVTNIRLGAVDSLIDFDNSDEATVQDPIQYNVTNAFGVSIPYYFYRSDSTGAIAVGQSITIFF